ncbi:33952_t:CDS:2, partial [Racocetra persica]
GEILTKKREQLATHNISKGFAKTASEDNRREAMELVEINQLLLEIRYLENDGDATTLSSVDAENTALTAIDDIIQKADLAISRIKAGKYTENGKEHDISFYGGLEKFKEHFENKEKLVKLKTLIKKVIGTDGKVKTEFIEEIKKSDATLVDLKTLLLKEPKDIITYIARFVYNQLDDSASDEKNKKKTQMKRRIAKKLNKIKESELTEQELDDSLYQIEIGELTLD